MDINNKGGELQVNLVPIVVEQTNRGERSMIFRLLERPYYILRWTY